MDPDFGQDAGLFAGVERVVDRLLDGGQQGLARVVEAQQVAVLGEELADRDVALAGGHRLGRGPAPRRAVATRGFDSAWPLVSATIGRSVGVFRRLGADVSVVPLREGCLGAFLGLTRDNADLRGTRETGCEKIGQLTATVRPVAAFPESSAAGCVLTVAIIAVVRTASQAAFSLPAADFRRLRNPSYKD